MLLGFFFLLQIVAYGYEPRHKCIHGTVKQEQHILHIDYGLPHSTPTDRRDLQETNHLTGRPDELFEKIRIRPFWMASITSLTQTEDDRILQMVIKDMISSATRYLEQFTKVIPIPGVLVVPHTKASCGDGAMPDFILTNHTGNVQGVVDTDLLLLADFGTCPSEGTLAYATACHRDQYRRPITGYIRICPALKQKQEKTDYVSSVILHEIGHIIGMSFSTSTLTTASTNFWNWATNSPVDSSVYATQVDENYYISSPNVKRVVAEYFNCDLDSVGIPGAQLEDQGGEGTIFTHWDERYFHSESMCGQAWDVRAYFSNLTLALMEDTGWYVVDYSYGAPMGFGRNAGCEFFTKKCLEEPVDKTLFCTAPGEHGCTYDHFTLGDCIMQDDLVEKGRQEDARVFTHTSDGTIGGSWLSNFCSFKDPALSEVVPMCMDPRAKEYLYERRDLQHVFGINSRCVELSVEGELSLGYCTPMECTGTTEAPKLVIHLPEERRVVCTVNDTRVIKAASGSVLKLSGLGSAHLSSMVDNKAVQFFCPDPRIVCRQSRPFACVWGWWRDAGANSSCVCLPGFAGVACEQTFSGVVGIDAANLPYSRLCVKVRTLDVSARESIVVEYLVPDPSNPPRYVNADSSVGAMFDDHDNWRIYADGAAFTKECTSTPWHLFNCNYTTVGSPNPIFGVQEILAAYICPLPEDTTVMQAHEEDRVPTSAPSMPPISDRKVADTLENTSKTQTEWKEYFLNNWLVITIITTVLTIILTSIMWYFEEKP